MEPRLVYGKVSPRAYQAAWQLEQAVRSLGIDAHLLHLLKLRASQINGCAFCIDMHVREALRDGETPQRLHLLSAWREAPIYTEKERALLEWTEAVTLVADTAVPDDVYDRARSQFSDEELVNLTLAIGTINMWNRLSVSFRGLPKDDPWMGMAAR